MATRKIDRRRASLESLPVEILEAIFLQDKNFSLPRAHPVIGAKLSSRSLLFQIFFAAFADTWVQGYGQPIEVPYFSAPDGFPELENRAGDPGLQTDVLELPWVTMDFILEAQQVWIDKFAKGRRYTHWLLKKNTSRYKEHPHTHDADAHTARECLELDYQIVRDDWSHGLTDFHPKRMQDVHPRTRIPMQLITGPWDSEKERRLLWLIRGGALGYSHSYYLLSWEARLQCLRNMILETTTPNVLVENLLSLNFPTGPYDFDPWLYWGFPVDVAQREIDGISERLKWGDDSETAREMLHRTRKQLAHCIDSTHFRQKAGSEPAMGRWRANRLQQCPG